LRRWILSKAEREIIERYLEDGTRLAGYYQLRHRLRKYQSTIQNDVTLITKFVKKSLPPESEISQDLGQCIELFDKISEWYKDNMSMIEKIARA
jgi:hypothetical protein